ncbi:MAG: cytochrome b [Rhodanobacteraceae bacterium]|mgnify:CR=1 FL=1|nr:cytochrome b [Rhodanobacteraceae bacterium]MBP9154906.1 cytochrome b [Xanthomonadales bacterium]HQW82487.1 cytochrome b [Pseudomonadota bacterium]
MSAKSDATRWGSVAKCLHWLIAIAVIGLLVGGLTMTDMKVSPDKFRWYALHKSFGVTVLVLMLLRFAWRGIDGRPQAVPGVAPIVAFAAHSVHRLFYVALIVMPISGWVYNSASNFPLQWFGVLQLPAIVAPDKDLKHLAHTVHEVLAWTIITLLLVHVAGALIHHFIDRDDTLRRMLPFAKPRAEAARTQQPASTDTP